jgi:hypothetical protein
MGLDRTQTSRRFVVGTRPASGGAGSRPVAAALAIAGLLYLGFVAASVVRWSSSWCWTNKQESHAKPQSSPRKRSKTAAATLRQLVQTERLGFMVVIFDQIPEIGIAAA